MNMRVIPIHARWLVFRNFEFVFVAVRWLHCRVQHIVLMADRRNVQTVKMKIGGADAQRATGARLMHGVRRHCLWLCGYGWKFILESQNQFIAGVQPQVWRQGAVLG